MGALSCVIGRHRWYSTRGTGLNGEIPIAWRCSTCGATRGAR